MLKSSHNNKLDWEPTTFIRGERAKLLDLMDWYNNPQNFKNWLLSGFMTFTSKWPLLLCE